MIPMKFAPILSVCHGNEIWDKMGYNAVSAKDICEIFASLGGSGLGR